MLIKLPPARAVADVPSLSQPLAAGSQLFKVAGGEFRVERLALEGGRRAGVEVVLVDTGRVRAAVLPTRGMSLWRANVDGIELGWQSPIKGPIHPQWVALSEPSGLGWLDGFDELLVRCGLRSFGAPDFDAQTGRLTSPLHGRIGNLPADKLEIEVDSAHSLLHVRGRVAESRFLQYDLQLDATYTFSIGATTIAVHDHVRNNSDGPANVQLLYHINAGAPLLSKGAQLHLDADRVVARDAHAAEGLSDWPSYAAPTAGYTEQVYFSQPRADAQGWASTMLTSADRARAFAVHYEAKTLPFFTQWKNTVGENDGYVTGLEPGTGFPNPHSFEKEKGRVVKLDAGSGIDFNLKLEGISSSERIEQLASTLREQTGKVEQAEFDADWCLPRN